MAGLCFCPSLPSGNTREQQTLSFRHRPVSDIVRFAQLVGFLQRIFAAIRHRHATCLDASAKAWRLGRAIRLTADWASQPLPCLSIEDPFMPRSLLVNWTQQDFDTVERGVLVARH